MKKRMLFIADMQYRAEELKGLKEQRADLVEQMRALAGKAETEKRAMSDEEKTSFDSLEEQQKDPGSIYNYVKQVIRIRNQNPAIARGTTAFLEQYSGEQCFALTRSYEDSTLLLLGNTSAETVNVDLKDLTVGQTAAEKLVLLGELYTGEECAERAGTVVTLPAYSILILGKK